MANRTVNRNAHQSVQQGQNNGLLHNGGRVLPVSISDRETRMAREVLAGLSARPEKTLPCAYFYDTHGSRLYERITELPEYYLTQAETTILRQMAPELRSLTETSLGEPPEIVELGSGNSLKTRIILDEWTQQQGQILTYMPVDVSDSTLAESVRTLTRQYTNLNVLGLAGYYEDALHFLPAQRERLFLFLGSSIGNFSVESQMAFFQLLKQEMGSESRLLLGYDQRPHAEKPVSVIELAYNDQMGVTAEFNLNLLTHINHRLGGNFNLSRWRHQAQYNDVENRIEMRLESLCEQRVTIKALDCEFEFEAGETILTELSRKFDPEELGRWFGQLGFKVLQRWQNTDNWYGMMLLEA